MVQPHLARVASLRDRWPAFRERIRDGALLAEAAARARPLFRSRSGMAFDPPPVALIVFSADARGYERVLLDPFHLLELDDPAGFIAHEFFHNWRRQIARWPDLESEREPLAWLLASLEDEGIADLLDKRAIPEMDDAALAAIHPDPFLAGSMRSTAASTGVPDTDCSRSMPPCARWRSIPPAAMRWAAHW